MRKTRGLIYQISREQEERKEGLRALGCMAVYMNAIPSSLFPSFALQQDDAHSCASVFSCSPRSELQEIVLPRSDLPQEPSLAIILPMVSSSGHYFQRSLVTKKIILLPAAPSTAVKDTVVFCCEANSLSGNLRRRGLTSFEQRDRARQLSPLQFTDISPTSPSRRIESTQNKDLHKKTFIPSKPTYTLQRGP